LISIKVIGVEEVTFRLDQLPRRLREVLRAKFENIFSIVTREFFDGVPGRFLDPKQVQTGIEEQGALLIGYIQYSDKEGVYSIYPTKGPFLISLKQQFFAREVHAHPFPKGAPMIERHLRESKPWIIDQLEDTVIEAL
jgi:hypothetical protein